MDLSDYYSAKGLNDVSEKCNMDDIPTGGSSYTWNKKPASEENLQERIDRVGSNYKWFEVLLSSKVTTSYLK